MSSVIASNCFVSVILYSVLGTRYFVLFFDSINHFTKLPMPTSSVLMSLIRVFGHFKATRAMTNVRSRITIYLRYLFLSSHPEVSEMFFLKNISPTPRAATSNQIIINDVPSHVPSKSGAFAIFITPMSPMVMIPTPSAMISLIQSPTRRIPNKATSMKLVGFAMIAKQNKKPDKTIYFNGSLCERSS